MAGSVIVNTNYARRDIARMRSAMAALADAERTYRELQSLIESTYKGAASDALREALSSEIKKVSSISSSLKTAADNLQNAVTAFEDYNKKTAAMVKGM